MLVHTRRSDGALGVPGLLWRYSLILVVATVFVAGARGDGTPSLIDRTLVDPEYANYPNFREHALTILRRKATETKPLDVNPYVEALLGGAGRPSVVLHAEDVEEFFSAAAKDGLTIVRAMGLVARAVNETRVLTYLNGADARGAVERLGLDIGLAVPMDHLLLFAYIPVEDGDGATQCRFLSVYGSQYEHRFHKDVLDATLKVGMGRDVPYLDPWDDDAEIRTAYVVEGRILYGDGGVGYADVSGIGGKKHGMLGVVQKMFFFLPDAIGGMVIRDGCLHVDAMVNQQVHGFEDAVRYAVHYRDGAFTVPRKTSTTTSRP
ncbi:MAG: hypothetical protein ABGY41_03810 [Candidatus Poribacteria bacterium]